MIAIDAQVQRDSYVSRIHRTFAGMCVALLLVGGLVSMPTSCACGAGIPHGHSLFILAGHHHGADGATFGSPAGNHDQHHHFDGPQAEPQLRGQAGHFADRFVVAVPPYEVAPQSWQRIATGMSDDDLPAGRADRPEIPPPQPRSHG